jgi:EpsI family protein
MFNARAYAPALILAIGCMGLLGSSRQVPRPPAAPMKGILSTVGDHDVKDMSVTKEELAVAGMSDYVARSYWKDSTLAFTTLVAYYDRQTQGKSIHSPRNCLPGAGWEILTPGTRVISINGVQHTLNRYTLKNGNSTAVAWYWYQGRGRVTSSEYAVKWNLLRDAALLGHTEEALVRLVVPVRLSKGDTATAAALARADSVGVDLAGRLIQAVDRVMPKASVGT